MSKQFHRDSSLDLRDRRLPALHTEGADSSLHTRDLSRSETLPDDGVMLSEAVRGRYRCPDEFLDFRLVGELSGDASYFEFGPDLVAYGRATSLAVHNATGAALYGASHCAAVEYKQVILPFNPDEVIDNLRLERYANGQWGARERFLKSLYYRLRPFTNLTIRKYLKQLYDAHRGLPSFPRWPVDTTVEDVCEKFLLLALQAHEIDRIPFIWFWPDGARSAVLMTHDVETAAGRDFCRELLDLDDRAGIKASFQIVPEDRYEISSTFLDHLRDRGFEVGI